MEAVEIGPFEKPLAILLAVYLIAAVVFLFMPSAQAQTVLPPSRVICLPSMGGWVDYPAGAVYTQPSGGYLRVTVNGSWVATWGPGQWVRVELTPAQAPLLQSNQ